MNAPAPIVSQELGTTRCLSLEELNLLMLEQPLKADSPILVILSDIVTISTILQFKKALLFITVTPVGMLNTPSVSLFNLFKLEQLPKAP